MNIEQLESFNLADAVKFHDKLNPLIWDKTEHLHPEIREQLLTCLLYTSPSPRD